jgi:hypothetical protein
MNRTKIINLIAQKISAQNYLEIGVFDGQNLNSVNIPNKTGVDPDKKSKATIFKTSDDFFLENDKKFDIIFIDGLHHADQVEKDINNSLNSLNEHGYIVCHDMLPTDKNMEAVPRKQGIWTGDCWKAWVKIRETRSDLSMFVIDTDYGCGIITFGSQDVLQISEELTFENYQKNRQKWMNVISVKEFEEMIK